MKFQYVAIIPNSDSLRTITTLFGLFKFIETAVELNTLVHLQLNQDAVLVTVVLHLHGVFWSRWGYCSFFWRLVMLLKAWMTKYSYQFDSNLLLSWSLWSNDSYRSKTSQVVERNNRSPLSCCSDFGVTDVCAISSFRDIYRVLRCGSSSDRTQTSDD